MEAATGTEEWGDAQAVEVDQAHEEPAGESANHGLSRRRRARPMVESRSRFRTGKGRPAPEGRTWTRTSSVPKLSRLRRKTSLTTRFIRFRTTEGPTRRVVVMHQGSVFAAGLPEEIRSDQSVQHIYLGEED